MTSWQTALQDFLHDWQKKPEYEGALLAGSYAAGTQAPQSDIDVMLVLSNQAAYYERGCLEKKGFLIEYLAQPSSKWSHSFTQDHENRTLLSISIFVSGIIIFDPKGIVSVLKTEAEALHKQPILKMNDDEIELAKYHLADGLSKLQNTQNNGFESYAPQYYLQLSKIIGYYAHFSGIVLPATTKWERFLNDSNFRDKYHLQGFGDRQFITLFNVALHHQRTIEAITQLTNYTLEKLGGFDHSNWTLRTEVTKS